MNVSLCTNLFSIDFIKFVCGGGKKSNEKPRVSSVLSEMLDELEIMLSQQTFDNRFIYHHVLNKSIQLVGGEYGFIGKVEWDPKKGSHYLQVYAITNIAWNSSSQSFFQLFQDSGLRFNNLKTTLFGETFSTHRPLICNKYDYTKRKLLPPGHPTIKRCICVPLVIQGETKYIMGICNKRSTFTNKDSDNLIRLLSILFFLHAGTDT